MRRLINFLLYATSIFLLVEHFGWTDLVPFIPHQPKTEETLSKEETVNKEPTPSDQVEEKAVEKQAVIEKSKQDSRFLLQTNQSIDSISKLIDSLTKYQQRNLSVETRKKENMPIDSTPTKLFSLPLDSTNRTAIDSINKTIIPSSDTIKLTTIDTLQSTVIDSADTIKEVPIDSNLRDTIGFLYPIQPPKPTLGFALQFKKEKSSLPITTVFLLPKEIVRFSTIIQDTLPQTKFRVKTALGKIQALRNNQWRWRAPAEIGIYPIYIQRKSTKDSMILQCIVQVPIDQIKDGQLDGFPIGAYPPPKHKDRARSLKPPKGFVRVDSSNENTYVSPHYQLKDFLSHQEEQFKYPNYVVLNEQLLAKLELLTNVLQQTKLPFDHFSILGAYRTPYYNQLKKNKLHSRHQWGLAADLFIDQNGDHIMDDLNQDGQLTGADAEVLYHILDQLQQYDWYKPFVGGMGLYKKNKQRTSFIHVDVGRNLPIRWIE